MGGMIWSKFILKWRIKALDRDDILYQTLSANYFGTDQDQFALRRSGALLLTSEELLFIPITGKGQERILRNTIECCTLVDHFDTKQLSLPLLQVKTDTTTHLFALSFPKIWKNYLSGE